MAWIEYHTQLRDHWKIQRLADHLEVEYHHALGIVSCLWLWCVDYASDGDISRFSDSEIRRGVRTNLEKFCKNLLKNCELIDDKERINDWKKHGIKLLESNRLRQKKHRLQSRYGNVTVTPTNQPNQPYQPKQPKDNDKDTARARASVVNDKGGENSSFNTRASVVNGQKDVLSPYCIAEIWNRHAAGGLPRVRIDSPFAPSRLTSAKKRIEEHPEKSFWESLMARINKSDFLRGMNSNKWTVSFDWIINPTNLSKILEGNYDNKNSSGVGQSYHERLHQQVHSGNGKSEMGEMSKLFG